MVLDVGRVVEFDTPESLLAKETIFAGMVKEAGLLQQQQLEKVGQGQMGNKLRSRFPSHTFRI